MRYHPPLRQTENRDSEKEGSGREEGGEERKAINKGLAKSGRRRGILRRHGLDDVS